MVQRKEDSLVIFLRIIINFFTFFFVKMAVFYIWPVNSVHASIDLLDLVIKKRWCDSIFYYIFSVKSWSQKSALTKTFSIIKLYCRLTIFIYTYVYVCVVIESQIMYSSYKKIYGSKCSMLKCLYLA